jgi:DNA repair protein RadC
MPIKDLPLDAQPREKLAQRGAAALSDAELLAIMLRTGMAGKRAADGAGAAGAARHRRPGRAAGRQLPGFGSRQRPGPAKRAELMAVLELARRATAQQLREREVFSSPRPSSTICSCIWRQGHEVFAVLFLDSQNRLLALEEMFRGTLTQTSVYPREVVLRALHHQAGAVILAHNHPSGSVQPSSADRSLTRHSRPRWH